MLLLDLHCRKFGLMDLADHDDKRTSANKMISNSYQRYQDANIIYCSHFLVIIEATSKYVIVFVRLILGKAWVDSGPKQEIDLRCKFNLKVLLKELGCRHCFSNFWLNFQATIKFVIVSVTLILSKVGFDRFPGSWGEIDVRYEFHFKDLLCK